MKKVSYLVTDLTELLANESFDTDEVVKVVGSGGDEANTPIELWARYFAVADSKNMEEFIRQRGIVDRKSINAVKRIIVDVENLLDKYNKFSDDYSE